MAHGLDGTKTGAGGVLEQSRHQVDRFDRGAWSEDLNMSHSEHIQKDMG